MTVSAALTPELKSTSLEGDIYNLKFPWLLSIQLVHHSYLKDFVARKFSSMKTNLIYLYSIDFILLSHVKPVSDIGNKTLDMFSLHVIH